MAVERPLKENPADNCHGAAGFQAPVSGIGVTVIRGHGRNATRATRVPGY